jgi:rRNA maturation endonuclease Nob1
MLQASVSGVIKMILILIGSVVVMRFLGQIMNAKRNIKEEQELDRIRKKNSANKVKAQQDFGKVKISKPNKNNKSDKFDDASIE